MQTNPLKIVKQVAMGPSFFTLDASASIASLVITRLVSLVMRKGSVILDAFVASSVSNNPNYVLSTKLRAERFDPVSDRESMLSELWIIEVLSSETD